MLKDKIKMKLNADDLHVLYNYTEKACLVNPKSNDFDTKLIVALMHSLNRRLLVRVKFPKPINVFSIPLPEAIALHQVYLKNLVPNYSLTIGSICGTINQKCI